jgi:hypothetical protein
MCDCRCGGGYRLSMLLASGADVEVELCVVLIVFKFGNN